MIFMSPLIFSLLLIFIINSVNAWNRVMLNARRPAFCLDRSGNYYTITAKTCTNAVAQQWYFDASNRLINHNLECLFEISGSATEGSAVHTGLCDTSNYFKWQWNDAGQIVVQSSKVGAPMCLDVKNGLDTDGTPIVISSCSVTSQSQIWSRGFTCLAGQSYNAAKDGCVACTAGYKSTQGNTACLPCPTNSLCPTVTDFTCNMGYTRSADGKGCSACPLGVEYKPADGNQACTACPTGAVCPTISSFVCAPGYGLSGTSCVQCSGTTPYKNTFGNTACQECPPNSQCSGTSFTCLDGYTLNSAKNGCDRCSSITYKPFIGNDTCLTCPAGANCTASSSFACKAGFELSAAKSECKLCDIKYFKASVDNSSCALCNVGTEYVSDRSSCATCKDQWYRPSQDYEKCIACPNNATCSTSTFACLEGYQMNAAETGCEKCSLNSFKADPGNGQCSLCPIGQQSNLARTGCDSCVTGTTYRSSLSMPSCLQCPTGATCNTTSFTCNPGWRVKDDNNGCVQCEIGREPVTIGSKQECSLCEPNMHRSSLTMGSCAPCPNYATCPTTSSFTCNRGYSKNADSTACVYTGCPANFYKPLQDDNCYTCPVGSECYANSFQCSAGYFYSSPTKSCVACPAGLYKPAEGNINCTTCPNIGTQPSADKTKCETCPTDKFRPSLDFTACITCPVNGKCTPTQLTCKAGYIKDAQNTLSCVKCPSGTIRPLVTDPVCVACGHGKYPSDDATTCVDCPSGTFKLSTGQCMDCPIGTQPNDIRTTCVVCPEGSFRPSNTTGTCLTCPNGAKCSATAFTCLDGFTINTTSTGCIVKTQEMGQTADSSGAAIGGTFAVVFILAGAGYVYMNGPPDFLSGNKPNTETSSTTNLNLNSSSYTLPGQKTPVTNSLNTLSKPLPSAGTMNGSKKPNESSEWSNASFNIGGTDVATQARSMASQARSTTYQRATVAIIDQAPSKTSSLPKYPSVSKLKNVDTVMTEIDELDNIIAGIEEKLPTDIQFEIGIDFRSQKFIGQEGIYKSFVGTGLHRNLLKYGDTVLIKELIDQNDSDTVESMQREVRTLHKMQDCKYIVRLLGYSKNPNLVIIKNHQIGTLELWIASRKFIKRKTIVLNFISNIAEALSYIHKKGYSHCSLRPSNILLELDEEAGALYCVLSGFNDSQTIAQPYKVPKKLELNYSTRAYLAPEIQRQLKVGATTIRIDTGRADVYSFGIILYQVITRQLPWSR